MQQVITELERVGRRSRFLLLAQRVSLVLAWAIAGLIAVIVFDYALRLPAAFRLILLLLGLAGVGYALWVYIRPAAIFRPSLTELALRVERIMPALSGRLASSVEFAAGGIDQGNQLAARAVRETQTRLAGESISAVIDAKRTWRDGSIMLAVIGVAVALAIASPGGAATGLTRLFLPYSNTKWPARTGVESLMSATVHPRGAALPLRAQVTRGPNAQRIDAQYRLRTEGQWQPWQRIVLTHQAAEGAGNVHERLIDTDADEIELYFTSDDDETSAQRIELVPPPAVRRATLTVTPPAYAAPYIQTYEMELGQGVDQRAVTQAPSLIGSSAFLRLELNKALPQPQSIAATFGWSADETNQPTFTVDSSNPAAWNLTWRITATRELDLNLVDEHGLSNFDPISYRIEAIADTGPSVTITTPPNDEVVLPTAIVDLRAEARDDVALAKLTLEAHVQGKEISADEAIATAPAWNHAQDAAQPAASIEAPLPLESLHVGEGDVVLVSSVARDVYESTDEHASEGEAPAAGAHEVRSPLRRLRVIGETDFATQLRRQLGAVRQNAIRIEAQQAELQENVIEEGVPEGSGMDRAQAQVGERIAAQRESVRDIERILRQNRLDDQQLSQILQQANDLLDAAGRAASRATEEIQKRPSAETSNREDDMAASETEREAPDDDQRAESKPSAPGSAGGEEAQPQPGQPRAGRDEASRPQQPSQPGERQAPQDDEQRSEGDDAEPQDEEQPQETPTVAPQPKSEDDREVVEAQQEVRDELTDLIKLLDRDEDTWVVRRQLENLAREQAELEQATAQLGEQTIGRRPEQLTEQQRTELDRITQRQRDLRDEARKLIENMRNRAKALEQVDPQAAEAMRTAADTAEQRQLDQDMENAAQRAEQNQMTSATAAQQSAQSTMQRMQEDIENTRRAQAQQLIRQLASLVESIQRLINVQENELTALGLAEDAQNFNGLDRGMIRLNQNTQAVAGEARAAGAEARRVARTLDRAAASQGAAVVALRIDPIDPAAVRTAEERSLEQLKEAKTQADELQKQTQEQEMRRRREELITSYRAFAERQVVVRGETLPLSNLPQLDRRQLVEARRLGSAQDEIRTGLNGLRDVTSEILDSPIFVHVHRSIDAWSSAISDQLNAGTVNVDVTDRQQQIADSVGRLIKALEESMAPPDEFAQDQQQNQEGEQNGGQQGEEALIPPIAQLKLLRELQDQVYNLTKELDTRQDLDSAQKRTRLREVGQQQRELLDLGKQMLEQLQRQLPPAPPEIDAPEGGEPPPSPEPNDEPQPLEAPQ